MSDAKTNDAQVEKLLSRLAELGLESEDLDELVHECASAKAADVNNSGVDGQVEYVLDCLGLDEALSELSKLAD